MKNILENFIKEFVSSLDEEDDFQNNTPAASPAQAQRRAAQNRNKFDVNTLKTLKTPEDKIRYATDTLKSIGVGSGREVFSMPDGKEVLKIAKNSVGVSQNKNEAIGCSAAKTKDLFAKISAAGDDFTWIVAQRAGPMNPQKFEASSGMNWKTFTSALKAVFPEKTVSKVATEEDKQSYQALANHPMFIELINIIKACKYEPGDLVKMDSWGTTDAGKPVIIDYGLTDDTAQEFNAMKANAGVN